MTGGYLHVLADTLRPGPWVAAAASLAITLTAPRALGGVLEGRRPQPAPWAVLFTTARARAAQVARDTR